MASKKTKAPEQTDIEKRVERVRAAVAEVSEGLKGAGYRAFMEELLADAEGWRMELEETGEEGDEDE